MAVIKEIKNGSGGVIRIHDDYCKNNTPEDNQKIIDNVSRIVNDYYIFCINTHYLYTNLRIHHGSIYAHYRKVGINYRSIGTISCD